MNYLLPFLSALTISAVLTGILRRIGIKFGIVSKPRERDVHKKPIPRIGGVAIFLSFVLVVFGYVLISGKNLSFAPGQFFGIDRHLFGILAGGTLIVLTMFLDDLFGLKPWQKLLFQTFATLVVIASGIGINSLPNPFGTAINLNSVYVPIITLHGIVYHFSLWSDLLTLVWLVGMMNVVNFIDGVDGLAGGVSSIAAFTIFLLSISVAVSQPSVAVISITLAGSCIGFLLWNFPPAKIFMGDAGSIFLGFMLGILPLISGGKLATAFLVLGFPIVDGLLVAGGRIIRKQNPFTTPDKTHLHHRFLGAGFTPRQAILSIYVISAAFGWVALRSSTINKLIAAIVLVLVLILISLALNYRRKVINRSLSNMSSQTSV